MRIGMARSLGILTVVLAFSLGVTTAPGQSSDQLFPTPVRTSEVVGTIKARDIGDARLTTYYYTFEGEQGDLFINVQSENFTGDIDVFIAAGLRPLTKMVMYADQPQSETGRVIYLRKPERLMLRVQGRSPGDDDAVVRIKFAGSFAASRLEESGAPSAPKVESVTESNIRVNSVGTILEATPKTKATPEPAEAEITAVRKDSPETDTDTEKSTADRPEQARSEQTKETKEDRQDVKSDPSAAPVEEQKADLSRTNISRSRRTRGRVTAKSSAEKNADEMKTDAASTREANRRARVPAVKKEEVTVDPMAGIRLVVYFKDGSSIDRPMTEVMRFSVEKAILTVISKNGSIGRYNMTEVARVSIE